MRTIDTAGFATPATTSPGPAPMLQWVKVADLVVDERYQRPIRGEGATNVRKIVGAFRWPRFAPVVVAPVEGGLFAIIDGQHRTTAAALCGIESVPCQVVVATPGEQADAFKAINGATTKMQPMTIHYAAVVAGDKEALAVEDVCLRAEVSVLRHPVPLAKQEPGQTMAVVTLRTCLGTHGRDTLVTALQCVTQTENGKRAGLLVGPVIKALCTLLSANLAWRESGEALMAAFDEIDLEAELEAARSAPKPKGRSTAMELTYRLQKRLAKRTLSTATRLAA
jgi:hypothetical protein